MNQFVCHSCDAEYEVVHDIDNDPIYCPFCGELNLPSQADDEDEELEYDEE